MKVNIFIETPATAYFHAVDIDYPVSDDDNDFGEWMNALRPWVEDSGWILITVLDDEWDSFFQVSKR